MSLLSLTLIQLVVFTLYVGFITKKFGVLPSISDSWYSLPVSQKALFTLFTWGIGIPMLFYGNVWFFLSGVGLTFVGAATQFKMTTSYTKQIHYIGALTGILFSLIGIGVEWFNWVPLVTFCVLTLLIYTSKHPNMLWWIEMAAVGIILGGLLLN